MSDSIHLLKTRRFLPLFITQFLGAFNDNAFKNALLIWFAYDIAINTGANTNFVIAIAAGLFILPFFLFSATAGQLADKYEKSWLTQKIKQIEIVLTILCAAFFYLESISGLLFVLFMMGSQSTFFGPIKYSLLPEHLKDSELIGGNGLIEGGTFLSILLGTIFGGLIVRTEYGLPILSLCLISCAIIGWIASRSIPLSHIGDGKLKISWNICSQTAKIIEHARAKRSVWLSIIGISWFWFIGVTFITQFPLYTKEVIGGNEVIVTLFITIFSIGVGIGALLCNKLLRSQINGRLVPYGSIGISVAILLFVACSKFYSDNLNAYIISSASNSLDILELSIINFLNLSIFSYGIVLSLLMLSIFAGIYIVPLYAIMQHRSEEKYLARIIAANNVMNALFMVLASIFALAIFGLGLDIIELLLIVGMLNIPVFFIIKKIVRRRVKK